MKHFTKIATLGLVTALGLAVVASPAFAGSYGMAGCGLGSMLFGPSGEAKDSISDTKVKEILAATTNGTFGSTTFGITTGTSNCTQGGVVKSSREAEAFAEVNLGDLSRDVAAGGGEYLAAMGTLLGCDATAQADLGAAAQSSYEQIFPTTEVTATDVVRSLQGVVRSDTKLAQACKQI